MQQSFRNVSEGGIGAQYILIPSGRFIYSVSGAEESVPSLYFAKYAVTNEQYRLFIAFLSRKDNILVAFLEKLKEFSGHASWGGNGFGAYLENGKNNFADFLRSSHDEDRRFSKDNQPVVGVTWYAAKIYTQYLCYLSGYKKSYRLPNEKEWEWAAGGIRGANAQKVRAYPWPDEKGSPTQLLANYNDNEAVTTPVGRHWDGSTPEGLCDMAGNVWEWMDYLPKTEDNLQVLRGGSLASGPAHITCSARISAKPTIYDNDIGFRVVCDV